MGRKSMQMVNGIIILICLLMAVPSSAEVIKRYGVDSDKEDLMILGFGEVTTHFMSIKGNTQAFENANSWLKSDFASNYRASLFANGNVNKTFYINGTGILDSRIDDEYRVVDPSVFRLRLSMNSTEPLWDDWRFSGQGLYDPQRQWEFGDLDYRLLTQPQEPARLELMARLDSEKHGYIEGGSLHPSFADSKFSLHQRSLFGAFADVHSGPVGVEGVAGKLDGKSYREGTVVGIRANGTAGPYDLSFAPVTRGSEVIKIETRDRFNESTVLSSKTLVRDVDYTVDYLRGRIQLHQPVASESLASDPVYIVITYDYQRTDNDDLYGTRLRAMPAEGVTGAVSYLHRNRDAGATGIGEGEPDDLRAADFSFDLDGLGKGYVEIAESDNPGTETNYSALRAGASTKIGGNLGLAADFQKIDDRFLSFTNSDLNPTKNQQRLDLSGIYDFSESQNIKATYANYRGLEANGTYNTYNGLREENIYRADYRNRLNDKLNLGLGFELRDVKDRENLSNLDNRQDRAIVDLGGKFNNVGILGRFDYDAHYELITFRNEAVAGPDNSNSNQVSFAVQSTPREGTFVKLTQKLDLRRDMDIHSYDYRKDASFAVVRVQPHHNLSSLTTLEYKRYTQPGEGVDFWQDDPRRIDWAGTFALEYYPVRKVKALATVGHFDSETYVIDSAGSYTDDHVLGQFTYFHSHHLSFDAETEYSRKAYEGPDESTGKVWDLGIKLNWNRDRFSQFTIGMIRRWESDATPPLDEISSASYILLLSGATSLGHGFFTRGSVKTILLRETLDDEKTYSQVEFGYEHPRWYRVSVGYERIESDTDAAPDRYYRGQGVFVRLVGKM